MSERLYTFRPDQGYFDVGLSRGKQLLLLYTVHEIYAHWFDAEGNFVGMERFRMAFDPPTFPGTSICQTGSAYEKQAHAEKAALKDQLGFQAAEIRVLAFETEWAAVADLPGEYERFLECPESADSEEREYFPGYIAEWRAKGRFVLTWYGGEYWLSVDGEVLSHD
jgi:hypothetical protein